VDPVRHALCALSPETQDVAFTWEQADALTRTGLLGDIANPVHRVATLLWKRFGGRVDSDAARAAADEAGGWMREARDAFLGAELRRGLRAVWELGRYVNRVLAETEPWRLPDAEAHAALSRLVPFLDAIGIAAWPVVPETAQRIRSTLGRQGPPSSWDLDPTPPRMAAAPQVPLRQ
jgi:methionyl-tRNA synthetase